MEGNTSKILGVIIALVIVVGGIVLFTGSDDEDESTDTANTSQQAEDQAEAPAEEASSTIVDLAVATEALSTLVDAVTAADLVETLSNPDANFTVFAPTNDAFAALPEGTLESLLAQEGLTDLTSILTYHVVDGEVFSSDLTDGQVVETLQGGTLTVSIEDGVVMINDAIVVTPDVDASNGVVNVIDGVLTP